jgi:hypothetical protein
MANYRNLEMLGLSDTAAAFNRSWSVHGMPTRNVPGEGLITVPRQTIQRHAKNRESFRGFAAKAIPASIKAMDEGVLGGNVVGGAVPLVFDPEVLDILKTEAPLLARVPEEGQQGYKAVVNRIDARDVPLGFRTETESADLTAEVDGDVTFGQIEVDMEIWVDKVSITEFSQRASSHYLDVRSTALGARIAQYSQAKERNILYGDPALATNTGSFGDTDGYEGFATIIDDAGNLVDKTTVDLSGTKALLKDIKAEIKSMLQGTFAVAKSDLEVWTSHTLFDELENEIEVGARIDQNADSVNFGFEMLRISGIPVIASHNVATHSDDANDAGSEGDVFIMNRREMAFRALMPLSTVPLGIRGFSQQVALGEFGAPVLKGAGKLSRLLQGYAV